MSVASDFRENKSSTRQWYSDLQTELFYKAYSSGGRSSGTETCGLSFLESVGIPSPGVSLLTLLDCHRRAALVQSTVLQFSAPSPFNLPPTDLAVLVGLYLRWILSDLVSKGSASVYSEGVCKLSQTNRKTGQPYPSLQAQVEYP